MSGIPNVQKHCRDLKQNTYAFSYTLKWDKEEKGKIMSFTTHFNQITSQMTHPGKVFNYNARSRHNNLFLDLPSYYITL